MADYSPPYSKEDAKFDRRKERVVAAIGKLRAGDLTVAELLIIMDAFRGTSYKTLGHYGVEALEIILKSHK